MIEELPSLLALLLLLILIFSGKVFRDNWKMQKSGWKMKCWLSGVVAFGSFIVLAFVPMS